MKATVCVGVCVLTKMDSVVLINMLPFYLPAKNIFERAHLSRGDSHGGFLKCLSHRILCRQRINSVLSKKALPRSLLQSVSLSCFVPMEYHFICYARAIQRALSNLISLSEHQKSWG